MGKIRDNFNYFASHYTCERSEILGVRLTVARSRMLGSGKNPHDIFIDLDASIVMVVRANKLKTVALVKWLSKRDVEKIQKKRQQAIEERDAELTLLKDDLLAIKY